MQNFYVAPSPWNLFSNWTFDTSTSASSAEDETNRCLSQMHFIWRAIVEQRDRLTASHVLGLPGLPRMSLSLWKRNDFMRRSRNVGWSWGRVWALYTRVWVWRVTHKIGLSSNWLEVLWHWPMFCGTALTSCIVLEWRVVILPNDVSFNNELMKPRVVVGGNDWLFYEMRWVVSCVARSLTSSVCLISLPAIVSASRQALPQNSRETLSMTSTRCSHFVATSFCVVAHQSENTLFKTIFQRRYDISLPVSTFYIRTCDYVPCVGFPLT